MIVFLPKSIGSRDFWRIYNNISRKGKSSLPPLFNGPEVSTSASDKAELLAKLFCSNSTLDDSGHKLPDFPPKTEVQLSNLDITTADVASIIKHLDPSKATGPDGIPVVVLQQCSPELSPILAKLFKKCISESCFPSSWKIASVVPVKILGKGLIHKTTVLLVFFLSSARSLNLSSARLS